MDIAGLDEPVQEYITAIKTEYEKRLDSLKENAEKEIALLRKQIELLNEQMALARYRQFARKSEVIPGEQFLPFLQEETKESPKPPEDEEKTQVAAHQRSRPGRKPLNPNLPRVEVFLDIPESEMVCGCGDVTHAGTVKDPETRAIVR
jgi:hypothetical protein